MNRYRWKLGIAFILALGFVFLAPLERFGFYPKQSLFPYFDWGLGFEAPFKYKYGAEVSILGVNEQLFKEPQGIKAFVLKVGRKWHKNGGYKPVFRMARIYFEGGNWKRQLEEVYFKGLPYGRIGYRVRFMRYDVLDYYLNKTVLESIEEDHVWKN